MRLLQTTSTHGVVHFIDPRGSNYPVARAAEPGKKRVTYKCLCGSHVSINGGIQTAGKPFTGKICSKCGLVVGDLCAYYNRLDYEITGCEWTGDEQR
jgi:hypothetical protein